MAIRNTYTKFHWPKNPRTELTLKKRGKNWGWLRRGNHCLGGVGRVKPHPSTISARSATALKREESLLLESRLSSNWRAKTMQLEHYRL